MRTRSAGIIIKENKILLLKRVKEAHEYYIFPGGTVEEGENPKDACIRELKEETNLDVKIDKLFFEFENFVYGKLEKEYYFLITEFTGELDLFHNGTEQELEMKSGNTEYGTFELKWCGFDEISELNILPQRIKLELLNYIKN